MELFMLLEDHRNSSHKAKGTHHVRENGQNRAKILPRDKHLCITVSERAFPAQQIRQGSLLPGLIRFGHT
jgi:hypothetical protein